MSKQTIYIDVYHHKLRKKVEKIHRVQPLDLDSKLTCFSNRFSIDNPVTKSILAKRHHQRHIFDVQPVNQTAFTMRKIEKLRKKIDDMGKQNYINNSSWVWFRILSKGKTNSNKQIYALKASE